MDLSHQSITGRDFELNRRGYDPDVIDAHLEEIAAAVAERAARLAELEGVVESLQARVQDADESQEALRLTLKAAAHAKEELLANAREQATTMEDEATARAESLVGDAEARASELTQVAESRAKSTEEEARARAGEVAKAALAESEVLVARIEDLRTSLETAESALGALQSEVGPHVAAARSALETALSKAREGAEDPSILAASAPIAEDSLPDAEPETEHHEVRGQYEDASTEELRQPEPDESIQSVEQHDEPHGEHDQPHGEEVSQAPDQQGTNVSVEEHADPASEAVEEPAVPVSFEESTAGFEAEQPDAVVEESTADDVVGEEIVPEDRETSDGSDAEPSAAESGPDHAGENGGPHLEVVESEESAADISDKVDRLLEELREVT